MQLLYSCRSIFECKRNQSIITEEVLTVIRNQYISSLHVRICKSFTGVKNGAEPDEQNNKILIIIYRNIHT